MIVPSFSRASSASRTGDRLTSNFCASSTSAKWSPGRNTSSRIASRILLITKTGTFPVSWVSFLVARGWRIGEVNSRHAFRGQAATMLKGYHSAPWSQACSGVCVRSGGRRSVSRLALAFGVSSFEFGVQATRVDRREDGAGGGPGRRRLSAYTLILLYA